MPTKILVFSGSCRSGSHNVRAVGCAVRELASMDCEVTRISLADYQLPLYDADLEERDGIPENAMKLARLFDEHDAVFILSPEYNGSLSPLLKNTIDWISRISSDGKKTIRPFKGKIAAIGAASPGAMGGISMLGHLRQILVRLGMLVVSEQVAIGNASSAFDDMDRLTDERVASLMTATCKSLVNTATALKGQ